jgi:UDP-N-acetylmuramoyl-L-alanyl-D-glutamate--2,6-diaminopimelate ligase
MMKLQELLQELPDIEVHGSKDIEISGLSSDSRALEKGYIFVAKRGDHFDGNSFIPQAVALGASCVLSDTYFPSIPITQITTPDVSAVEGDLAAAFYRHPSSNLFMVGITGTCGKTTTAYITRHIYSHFHMPSGLIGTVSYITGDTSREASKTTPDVITTQSLLRDIVHSGASACVMEVSSHALIQGRVKNIDFDAAVFTNLTHEHLDYHKTMEAYAAAKGLLFQSLKNDAVAILNAGDSWVDVISAGTQARIFLYAIEKPADVQAKNIRYDHMTTTFDISYNAQTVTVKWSMAGRFNVENALAAASVFLSHGYPLLDVAEALSTFASPPGRLERIENSHGIAIYVDYAHKEDALRKVLSALRDNAKKRLITVFGCGGDRDRKKRPLMARAAEELSDIVIVTSDNPRSEDPLAIIQEICSGFQHQRHLVLPDRKQAICHAIELAMPGDTVLIAGKGHEKYQIFSDETLAFDDCEVAKESVIAPRSNCSSYSCPVPKAAVTSKT